MASSRYKYVAVRDTLRDEIIRGVFAEDDKLPSESELEARFGVSRVTVRLALDELRASGLIESRQGKGYYVRRLQVVQDLGRLQGVGEIMAPLGIEIGYADITLNVVTADEVLAPRLGIAKGDPLVRIVRLTHDRNGKPIDFEHLYARPDSFQFRVRGPRW